MAPAKVSAFQVNLELTWVTRSVRLHAYAEQLVFREQRPLQLGLWHQYRQRISWSHHRTVDILLCF